MEKLKHFRPRRSSGAQPAPDVVKLEVPEESVPNADTGIQVIYGASVQMLPVAGQTISGARPLLEIILRMDPRSPILVNGHQVPSTHVITTGDVIEVVHQAGEKGAGA